MNKLTLFFIMFTSVTTIASDNPTKATLLQHIKEIAANQKPGQIESINAPYLKRLAIMHGGNNWSLNANLQYDEDLRFRNPKAEEKASIFHNETYACYCKNNETIKTSDISNMFSNSSIPPHLHAVILSIIHCIQGGRIISDPATKRSIEIWNDRGEVTKIE